MNIAFLVEVVVAVDAVAVCNLDEVKDRRLEESENFSEDTWHSPFGGGQDFHRDDEQRLQQLRYEQQQLVRLVDQCRRCWQQQSDSRRLLILIGKQLCGRFVPCTKGRYHQWHAAEQRTCLLVDEDYFAFLFPLLRYKIGE